MEEACALRDSFDPKSRVEGIEIVNLVLSRIVHASTVLRALANALEEDFPYLSAGTTGGIPSGRRRNLVARLQVLHEAIVYVRYCGVYTCFHPYNVLP
jgi:hypothetical protein